MNELHLTCEQQGVGRLGALTPTQTKICIELYSQPSVSAVLHPQIQPISDHTVLQYAFTEKNPPISGPVQFKPMLFKGQLYIVLQML